MSIIQFMISNVKERRTKMSLEKIPVLKTINEASQFVGLARYHLRQLVKQNKIKFILAGKKVLINMDSLIEYLNNGETQTETEEQDDNTSKIRKVGA